MPNFLINSKMNKILTLLLFIAFSIGLGAQTVLHYQACDTINIDECYIYKNGERIVIDTNVHDEVVGLFSVERVEPLNPNYCMLYLSKTDTIYTVYDSLQVGKSWVYLEDTSYSTKLYNVLMEKEEDFKAFIHMVNLNRAKKKTLKKDRVLIPLRLKRLYNIRRKTGISSGTEEHVSITVGCQDCQVIILHKKSERIVDCPMYNNLYRLIWLPNASDRHSATSR